MRVHHLNCGTMHPLGAPRIVCHVLLVETDNGLVLVDTGHGLDDCADPARRVGPTRFVFRPVLDRNETAARQVERLGFNRNDVRHIVITHFDMDHIGGISDFPDAQIHVSAAEVLGAMRPPTMFEKIRFRQRQWSHGPKVVEHNPDGEKWRGFAAAQELGDIAPGIVLVSLPGHTRGHACVAVEAGNRWVLHCGDAFYEHGALDGHTETSRVLRTFESAAAFNRKQVQDNHSRLAELYRRKEPDLFMISAHDADLYEHARRTA